MRDEVFTITTIKWNFFLSSHSSLLKLPRAPLSFLCICVDMKTCEREREREKCVAQKKKSEKSSWSTHAFYWHFSLLLTIEIFKLQRKNHNIVACRIIFFHPINTPKTMFINYNVWVGNQIASWTVQLWETPTADAACRRHGWEIMKWNFALLSFRFFGGKNIFHCRWKLVGMPLCFTTRCVIIFILSSLSQQ